MDSAPTTTFVVYRHHWEARHIALELPADSTQEQVEEAANEANEDAWESDKYVTEETYIEDTEGNRLFEDQTAD